MTDPSLTNALSVVTLLLNDAERVVGALSELHTPDRRKRLGQELRAILRAALARAEVI